MVFQYSGKWYKCSEWFGSGFQESRRILILEVQDQFHYHNLNNFLVWDRYMSCILDGMVCKPGLFPQSRGHLGRSRSHSIAQFKVSRCICGNIRSHKMCIMYKTYNMASKRNHWKTNWHHNIQVCKDITPQSGFLGATGGNRSNRLQKHK